MVSKLCMPAAFAVTAFMGLASAGAVSAAVDFSGERIEITVPYSAGGGTDTYARFLAPLLSEELPGKPTIIIRNIPGAGAIAGSNQFQGRAESDGTSVYALAASGALNFVFDDPRVKYQLDEWVPFLSSPQGTIIYAKPELGLHEPGGWEDGADQQVSMGANNPTGGDLRALLTLEMLGIDADPVFGLNRGAVHGSFERGEFNLNFDTTPTYNTTVVNWVDTGAAVPLLSLGISKDGEMVRDPTVPELPHFVELYREMNGEAPSGPAYRAWRNVFNLNVMASKALMLPSDTPQDVVDTYDQAIKDVLARIEQDPELQAKAEDILGGYPQATGDEARAVLAEALQFDDEAFNWLNQWLEEKFQVRLGG